MILLLALLQDTEAAFRFERHLPRAADVFIEIDDVPAFLERTGPTELPKVVAALRKLATDLAGADLPPQFDELLPLCRGQLAMGVMLSIGRGGVKPDFIITADFRSREKAAEAIAKVAAGEDVTIAEVAGKRGPGGVYFAAGPVGYFFNDERRARTFLSRRAEENASPLIDVEPYVEAFRTLAPAKGHLRAFLNLAKLKLVGALLPNRELFDAIGADSARAYAMTLDFDGAVVVEKHLILLEKESKGLMARLGAIENEAADLKRHPADTLHLLRASPALFDLIGRGAELGSAPEQARDLLKALAASKSAVEHRLAPQGAGLVYSARTSAGPALYEAILDVLKQRNAPLEEKKREGLDTVVVDIPADIKQVLAGLPIGSFASSDDGFYASDEIDQILAARKESGATPLADAEAIKELKLPELSSWLLMVTDLKKVAYTAEPFETVMGIDTDPMLADLVSGLLDVLAMSGVGVDAVRRVDGGVMAVSRSKSGVTLLQALGAAAVAAVAVPVIQKARANAERTECLQHLKLLGEHLAKYALDHGDYPDAVGGEVWKALPDVPKCPVGGAPRGPTARIGTLKDGDVIAMCEHGETASVLLKDGTTQTLQRGADEFEAALKATQD
jgi:hypothetical protein